MSIFYTVIARGNVILAEYSTKQGGDANVVNRLLSNIDSTSNAKKTYFYDSYEVEDGLIFMCISDVDPKRNLPFVYLSMVKKRFLSQFGDRWKDAISYYAQTEFSRVLRQLSEHHNESGSVDRISRLQDSIAEVKEIMIDNIDKALTRGEAIEDTLRKTSEVASNSIDFRRKTTSMKNKMRWRYIRSIICVVVVMVLLIYVITAIACQGPTFKGCRKG